MKKRLILVAVAALLPATALLGFNELASRNVVKGQIKAQALEENGQASSEIERIVDGARALMLATAAIPAVRNAADDRSACREALEQLVAAIPWVRTIFVLDKSGTLLCEPTGAQVGTSFADRPYFREVLAGNDFHIGLYTQSRLTASAVLPLALPIRSRDGQVVGVLTSGIRLDWLNDRLRERGLGERGALTIADREGVILARTPLPERFVGTRIPDAFQHLVKAPSPGVMEVMSQDGTTRVIAYNPSTRSSTGLYISVGLSKDDAYAAVNRQTFINALAITLGVFIALVAAWLAGGLIRRPLNRIVSVIHDWKAGNDRTRTGLKAADGDVESVGEALDQLLDELDRRASATQRAEQQRDVLMYELSHRVKNTLTLVQAIANQTFRRTDEQLARSFSERLIALSGAYDVLLGEQFTCGDIRAIIRAALAPHQARDESVTLHGEGVMLAPATALALSMIVHELATNATKYGALSTDLGSVAVTWSVRDGRVKLVWHERGGPPVSVPKVEGFGSKLLQRAFGAEAAAEVDIKYLLTGVRCELHFNASDAASIVQNEFRPARAS